MLDVRAARYLGCSVLQLEEMPLYWRERALMALEVEAQAQETLRKREEMRAKRR